MVESVQHARKEKKAKELGGAGKGEGGKGMNS